MIIVGEDEVERIAESGPPRAAFPGIWLEGRSWRGGHGEVFAGREVALGRRVAVKMLSAAQGPLATDFDDAGPLLAEVTGHPALVTVHDAGVTTGGRPYLVMELLPGRDLEGVTAARGSLMVLDVLSIGRRVANGMQRAHDAGFVHGDIRPTNILLDRWERPQMADLGLAALLADALGSSRQKAPGLLAHTAPEVLAGALPTPVSDVFSLTATLYTLVSGRAPFTHRAADPAETIRRIHLGEVVDLRGRGLPGPVWAVLASGLAADPQDRWPSMAALAAALTDTPRILTATGQPHLAQVAAPSPEDPPASARHDRAGRYPANSSDASEPPDLPAADSAPPVLAPAQVAEPLQNRESLLVAGGAMLIVVFVLVLVAVAGLIPGSRRVLTASGSAGEGLKQAEPLPATAVAEGSPSPPDSLLLVRGEGIAVGDAGDFYVADRGAHRVYRIAEDGSWTVVAGTGQPGYDGDGGPAAAAALNAPYGLAYRDGSLSISDRGNGVIRQVGPDGTITTLPVGGDPPILSVDQPPQGIAVAQDGTVFVTIAGAGQVVAIDPTGATDVIAGLGTGATPDDGGPARLALLDTPTDIAIDGADLVIVELGRPTEGAATPNGRIRRLTRPDGDDWIITDVPGGSGLNRPEGLAMAPDGAILVTSTFDNKVVRVADGAATVLAGLGGTGTEGDGGLARVALLNRPKGIAVTADGQVLVTEGGAPIVRRIGTDLVIATVVGQS